MVFNKRVGFTLAEVLLTLTIIGVVASSTIPALIQDTNNKEIAMAWRKAYANGSQAFQLASANYEFFPRTAWNDSVTNGKNFEVFKKQFKVLKECPPSNVNNNGCWAPGEAWAGGPYHANTFIDSSGMAWGRELCCGPIMVDVNGSKKPNVWGKDRFVFKTLSKQSGTVGAPNMLQPWHDIDSQNSTYCPSGNCINTSILLDY